MEIKTKLEVGLPSTHKNNDDVCPVYSKGFFYNHNK